MTLYIVNHYINEDMVTHSIALKRVYGGCAICTFGLPNPDMNYLYLYGYTYNSKAGYYGVSYLPPDFRIKLI